MNSALIVLLIWASMASLSFVEAYVEGRNPWDRRKLGWKLRLGRFCLPAYHYLEIQLALDEVVEDIQMLCGGHAVLAIIHERSFGGHYDL